MKSLNVLLDINYKAKLADFGMVKILQESESQYLTTGFRGTVHWSAPELFLVNKPVYNEKTDVYGYGVIMWELLTHEYPHKNLSKHAAIVKVANGGRDEFPDDTPGIYQQLIEQCWDQSAEARPTVNEIIQELKVISAITEDNISSPPQRKTNTNDNVEIHEETYNQEVERKSVQTERILVEEKSTTITPHEQAPITNNNINNNEAQNQNVNIPEKKAVKEDNNLVLLVIPDSINPVLIFAKSFCEYLKSKGQDCSEESAKIIIERTIGKEEIHYSITMNPEKVANNFKEYRNKNYDPILEKTIKKGNLVNLASYMIKSYTKKITQNYKGYVLPCDEMLQWVIETTEKCMLNNIQRRHHPIVITKASSQEHLEAFVLYCKAQGYQYNYSHKFNYRVSRDKYTDYSPTFFTKKTKPMTAFRELLAERDLVRKELAKIQLSINAKQDDDAEQIPEKESQQKSSGTAGTPVNFYKSEDKNNKPTMNQKQKGNQFSSLGL
jgi:hypothetical protein